MDSKSKPHFISTSPENLIPVTTKLQLAHHQSAEAFWRIRYHKCLRKVKGIFESIANRTTGDACKKWSEPIDVFTSP
ncbi:hypothetical protein L1987_77509 [Smallanthus sonchifolius]|uniref:Uncharacterized protein n=1 Tax=Smallanthus sonchifolius TaxID=185202 RepID=A0ACB8ZAC3_9ASTR|nr:hypothetical protein L1987_77509 [Smallanthus sonchifolius]